MPLDRQVIENALRDAVANAAGAYNAPATFDEAKIIHAKQDGPTPREPYVVINAWLASRRLGRDEQRLEANAPGVIHHAGNRRLTVSIHTYGQGAVALAERIAERITTEAIAEENLAPAGLAILDATEVRNLTTKLETRHQERGQFDLIVGTVTNWTEDVGYIESVGLEGVLGADSGATPPVNTTIT